MNNLTLGQDANGNVGVTIIDGSDAFLPDSGHLTVDDANRSTSVVVVNDDIGFYGTNRINVREGDSGDTTSVSLTVQRTGFLNSDETVDYTLVAGTASDGSDIVAGSGTLEFVAGEASKTFELPVIIGDDVIEGTETFTISFANEKVNVSVASPQTILITDDDVVWGLSAPQTILVEGTESDTQFSFTVTRGQGYAGAASVDYEIVGSGDHAADADDFVSALSGSIAFANGEMNKDIILTLSADELAEFNEAFTLSLTGSNYGSINPDTNDLSFSIINDDSSISISDAVVVENDSGAQTLDFTVTRFGTQNEAATVNYSVVGVETDAADVDNTQSGTVTFASVDAGVTEGTETQIISIQVKGDLALEDDETFNVKLSSPANATLSDAIGVGTITDNDTAFTIEAGDTVEEGESQTFTVTRLGNTSVSQTVNWAVQATTGSHASDVADFGGAFPSGAVTFDVGEMIKVITVTSTEDSDAELPNAFKVALVDVDGDASSPTIQSSNGAVPFAYGVIENDDSGTVTVNTVDAYLIGANAAAVTEGDDGTVNAIFTLTLDAPLEYAATVDYAVVAGASDPVDMNDFGGSLPSGTFVLSAGRTSFELSVPVSGDSEFEASENFKVVLSNLSPWVEFGSVGATTSSLELLGVITNDDSEVSVDASYTSDIPNIVTEGDDSSDNATIEFVVTRTGDLSKNVTVNYAVTSVSTYATPSELDGGLPSGTLTFDAGQDTKTVSVDVSADTAAEIQDLFKIQLSNPSAGLSIGNDTSFVAIADDDADTYNVTVGTDEKAEGDSGQSFTFTVTRSSSEAAASLDWAVSETTTDPALSALQFVSSAGVVQFAEGELSKQVVVEVVSDDIGDFDKQFDFTISNLVIVGSALSASIGEDRVSINVANDDAAYFIDAVTPLDDVEGSDSNGSAVEFVVRRDGDVSLASTVDWSVVLDGQNPAQELDFGGFIPSGTVTFEVGEEAKSARFSVLGDNTFEDVETYSVKLSNLVTEDTGARLITDVLTKSIQNDDNGVSVTTTTSSITEGDTGTQTVEFVFSVRGLVDEWVAIDYVIEGAGLNPANASDISSGNFGAGQLNLQVGQDGTATSSVFVDVRGDNVEVSDETLRLRITNVQNGVILDGSAQFDIIDDDSVVSILVADGSSAEQSEGDSGATTFAYTVTREGDISRAAVVDYEVVGYGDSAVTGADFVGGILPSGEISFASGEAEKTVSFDVVGDTVFEGNEGFLVRLVELAPDANAIAEASVADDAGQVVGSVINDDLASIKVRALNTNVFEGNGPGVIAVTLEVLRDGDNRDELTLNYNIINDGTNDLPAEAIVGDLTGRQVTFPAGESSAIISIELVPNETLNGNYDFEVEVDAVSAGYASDPARVGASVLDDDSGIFMSTLSNSVTEGGKVDFEITRGGSNLTATSVSWAISGIGTNPLSPNEFASGQPLSGSIAFADGVATATLSVQLVDDALIENAESMRFSLTGSSDNTQIIRTDSLDILISDDDLATNGGDVFAYGASADVINSLAGDDVIYAGLGADLIYAGDGADHVFTQGGADIVYAGAGDDVIEINSSTLSELIDGNAYLDGGLGLDVLVIQDSDRDIDLSALIAAESVRNVEVFDISGSNLTLDVSAILAQDQNQLMINGDIGDEVTITDLSDWNEDSNTFSNNTDVFRILHHDSEPVQLFVNSDILIV